MSTIAVTPHEWNLAPWQAIELQRELADKVLVCPLSRDVQTVAGADCAFSRDKRQILAVAVLCEARTGRVIASGEEIRPCNFPYVPGLLSFREAPAVLAAVEKLPVRPDLLMIDGQGLAHPRGLGIASHVGLLLDLPTIGVAKSRLCGEHRPVGVRRGCKCRLKLDGRTVGAVVRSRTAVKPLYVSVGHRITLDESVSSVLAMALAARLPEPTRRAHQLVSLFKKRLMA